MTEDRAALVGFDYCPDIRIAVTDGKGGVNFTLNGKGAPAGISLYHESYVASLKAELAAALAMQPPGDGSRWFDCLTRMKANCPPSLVLTMAELEKAINQEVERLRDATTVAMQNRHYWVQRNKAAEQRADAAMGLLSDIRADMQATVDNPLDFSFGAWMDAIDALAGVAAEASNG